MFGAERTAWAWGAALACALVLSAGCAVPYRVSFPLGGRTLNGTWCRPEGDLAGGLEAGTGLGGVNVTFQPGRLRIGPEFLVQYSTGGKSEAASEGFVELTESQIGAVVSAVVAGGRLHFFGGAGLAQVEVKEDYEIGEGWSSEYYRRTGEATGGYLHGGLLWCPRGGAFHVGLDLRYVGGTQMTTGGWYKHWVPGPTGYEYVSDPVPAESRNVDGLQYSFLVGWNQNW